MRWQEPTDPRYIAQSLAYDAMEAIDDDRIVACCRQALQIYPLCVDAMIQLAEIEIRPLEDYVAAMRKAVAAGRKDLGAGFEKKYRGVFWGELDTRPYMRALACLADGLMEWGTPEKLDEAIKVQEQLLKLNSRDNQGNRYGLMSCYLKRKKYPEAERLLKKYKGEWSAVFRWARLLVDLAYTGNDPLKSLRDARAQNRFVELYLTGQKRCPIKRGWEYSPGHETEAIYCVQLIGKAWHAEPRAKKWLKEMCLADSPSGP